MNRSLKRIAQHFGALVVLFFCSFSYSNAQINPGAPGVNTHTMGDDGYVSVPLQFGFPFYGKTFTHSFMFDNGVVGLYDPIGNLGCNPQNNWCAGQQWNGQQPNTNMGSQFSYMIAPLWADIAPNPNTKYYTQGTTEYQRYMWENIHEYYSGGSRLNTFGLELKPSGSIDAYYSLININSSNTFVGTIGNPSLGEWNTIGYYPFGTVLNQLPNWSIANTGANLCASDPLSSPSCPGYAAAYLTQQCTISPLYNSSCPGYQEAYFSQQCTANQLYNVNCPGYAAAYLTYQCSINPLYSTTCEGYEQAYFSQQCSINALYNTGCPGYEQAYLNQQCSISPLYSTQCSGYQTASASCSANPLYATYCPNYSTATTQCSLNALYGSYCPGYQTALNTCSTNPLSNSLCSGYTTASNACSANQLTYSYCPSYTTALTTCSNNPQSNVLCPGYNPNPSSSSGGGSVAASVSEPAVSSTGETKVAVIADKNVNDVITTTATSANPAQAATATVPLVQSNATTNETKVTTAAVVQEQKKEEKKDATTTSTSNNSSSSTTASTSTASSSKDQPKTARQELQERREAAAKAKAIEDGKNLADNVGKAVDMEQQKMVQNVVVQAMAFVPGFDAYGKVVLIDKPFYRPFEIYKGQVNVDNKILGRRLFGPSDRLHEEMIDSQYNRAN